MMAGTRKEAADAGFVVVDALLAVALVATAGSLVYALGSDVLRDQERLLDRSVAIATMAMLAKEVAVTGILTRDTHDAAFTYRVRPDDSSSLPGPLARAVVIEATSGDESISVSLVVIGPLHG